MFSLSRIGQVLQYLPRHGFERLVEKHRADRYTKGFGSWQQVVAMVYAQLSGVGSLRELEAGFNQHANHHYHLGMKHVRRSTLADANNKRNPELFADVVRLLMGLAGQAVRREREEMLYLLDSTTIALCGRGSEWTRATATRTPGLKLHILFARDGLLPVHQSITAANVNDLDEGRKLPIQTGATYVFDKGYCDYGWWAQISAAGARFVTRLKTNAAVRVQSSNEVDPQDEHILADDLVRFTHRANRGGHRNLYEGKLRRIQVERPGERPLVLVTNDLQAAAHEIAALYKERWQVELFFKWVKQHLKIKRFLGESENAVRIQLLTALIAYLLVALLRAATRDVRRAWDTLAELRTGLFLRPEEERFRFRRRRQQREMAESLQPGLFK